VVLSLLSSSPSPDPPSEPPPEEALPPGHLYRIAWGLYLVLAIAGGLWVGLRDGAIPLDLFLDPKAWWLHLGAGLGGAAGLLALWELGRRLLPVARELERQLGRVLSSIDSQEALALAVLSGFAEELFFRGAVQGAFASHGWLWAAFLFALLHTGPGRPYRVWTLFAFLAGLVFGGLTAWSGNLLAAVVAHTLVNAINLRRLALEGRKGSQGAEESSETVESGQAEPGASTEADEEASQESDREG